MQTFHRIEEAAMPAKAVALTIGNFDGVHIGHQAVLARVKEIAIREGGGCAAVTFENHPSEVLRPEKPVKSICTLPHKVRLIEKQGIDCMFLLPFTQALAALSAEEFIAKLRPHFPFTHLVLGPDATFGKDRQGDHVSVKKLSERLGFAVEYIPPAKADDITVSSSRIRACLEHGDLHMAKKLLGRPYSIYSRVVPGSCNGRAIGFPTANIAVQGLCLPPFGVYAVNVVHEGKRYPAVANLGFAPTVKNSPIPQLEVHLFNYSDALYGAEIEVEFHQYIRPEQKFRNIQELQQQIQRDVDTAKAALERH